MNAQSLPETLTIPLADLVGLGIEHWRLSTWLSRVRGGNRAAQALHSLRRMEDFLKQCNLEVRSMDGHPFDAGLAVRVVDTIDDPGLAEGAVDIAETVSPLVLWRGSVIRAADVVTRRGIRR